MKLSIFSTALLILAAMFASCRDSKKDQTETSGCLTSLQKEIILEDSLFNEMFDDTSMFNDSSSYGLLPAAKGYYGSMVSYAEVKPCLDYFKTTMAQHGVDEHDPRQTQLMITETLKITWAEIFRGKELKQFIKRAARLHRTLLRNNKNLEVQVRFGRYTHDFAMKHDPAREGRFCIFLVTKLYRDVNNDVSNRKWVQDGIDTTSFNFGGMEP